jgi:RNA polymerase sigma factor (sigma-70 family)
LPALRRFCWSLTQSAYDADDLLQATVERVLDKGVPEGVALTPWAFTVCRNLWVDEYRSRKVRQRATTDPTLSARSQYDGERSIHLEMELAQVNQAMAQLPQEQLLVLVMVAVQGLSYKAVAESLEIPIGTVMSRLARARERLLQLTTNTDDGEQ